MRVHGAIAAVLLAAGLAACGSSGSSGSSDNGVASKSADQIVAAAQSAANGLGSVHVAGTVSTGAQPVTMDLDLANGKGGRGSMSASGLSFQIISLGQTAYFSGGQSFWQRFGGQAAAQLLQGKWLKAPATGSFGSFAKLTDMQTLFSKLLASRGSLTKGSTSTVNGQKVIAINDSAHGGTLYVATTGKPYPIRVANSGSTGGQLTFDRFNEQVSLTAPPNAIDISSLKGK
jgi:hypothetical protein